MIEGGKLDSLWRFRRSWEGLEASGLLKDGGNEICWWLFDICILDV